MKKFTRLFLLFIIPLLYSGCSKEELISINGSTMGTTYSIKLTYFPEASLNAEYIKSEVDSVLKEVNRQMSTYIPDSEISRFNSSSDTSWFDISADFANVVNVALKISEISGGAFDITVEPLVNLWGFGPEKAPGDVPSEEEILARKALTGYHKLRVDTANNRIKKVIPGLQIDLSAIAKGFGVDKVSLFLESHGFINYMVEIGGEVRTKGKPASDSVWKIGISTPDNNFGIQKVLSLNDMSVATSGDYRNYFEKDGIRYSHTINPISGRPIKHNLASVTVLHKSCMLADGYATAISVIGTEKAMAFADKAGIEIFLLKKVDDKFVEEQTGGMNSYLVVYDDSKEEN